MGTDVMLIITRTDDELLRNVNYPIILQQVNIETTVETIASFVC